MLAPVREAVCLLGFVTHARPPAHAVGTECLAIADLAPRAKGAVAELRMASTAETLDQCLQSHGAAACSVAAWHVLRV